MGDIVADVPAESLFSIQTGFSGARRPGGQPEVGIPYEIISVCIICILFMLYMLYIYLRTSVQIIIPKEIYSIWCATIYVLMKVCF